MTNCINCKRNITDEEVEDKGYKCEDCNVYLCNDCSFDDKILYHFFVYCYHSTFCVECYKIIIKNKSSLVKEENKNKMLI